MIGPTGYPLGTYVDFYEETHFKMGKNDTLILYTDGLVEAKSNHKLWGKEGVLRSLEKVKSKSPKKMIDSLIQDATDFSNGQLQDDIGIVAFSI